MNRLIFLFDLDSVVTKQEILVAVSKDIGIYGQMKNLTEKTISGELPFKQSFLKRIDLLKQIPVSKIQNIVANIELNERVVDFIKKNVSRCYIVTDNLDVWIKKLIEKLKMENNVFSSKALVDDSDTLQDVFSVVDKSSVIKQMILPFVAIGAGNNDAEMIESAQVGIGFGATKAIAPAVLECATHVVYDEKALTRLLEKLV